MKRFTAATVALGTALGTALCLSTVPAQAAERQSSEVSDFEVYNYIGSSVIGNHNMTSSARLIAEKIKQQSSHSSMPKGATDSGAAKMIMSSLKNDVAKHYPVGTTAEIIAGSTAAVLVLAIVAGIVGAANSGLFQIPGFSLPTSS